VIELKTTIRPSVASVAHSVSTWVENHTISPGAPTREVDS